MTQPPSTTISLDRLLTEARALLRRLDPAQSRDAVVRGGVIVDIRSDAQRAADGRVPGARYVPRNVLEWRLDPDGEYRDPFIADAPGPIVVMCAEGYQSSLAAANLQRIGVRNATDMIGGFAAWRQAGLPIIRP